MNEVNLEARRILAARLLEAARGSACPFLNAVDGETRAGLEVQFADIDPHGLSGEALQELAERHGVDMGRLEEAPR
jgi:hypothetical protein